MQLAPGDDDSGSGSGTSDPATPPVTDTAGNPVPTAVNAGVEGGDASSAVMLTSLAGLLGLGALARVRRSARG
jgi:MYXO-CTERM domain-containing protein